MYFEMLAGTLPSMLQNAIEWISSWLSYSERSNSSSRSQLFESIICPPPGLQDPKLERGDFFFFLILVSIQERRAPLFSVLSNCIVITYLY